MITFKVKLAKKITNCSDILLLFSLFFLFFCVNIKGEILSIWRNKQYVSYCEEKKIS